MAPSLEHEVDIGQISIAKYSNNPPSPDRKKSAGDTGRQNGRHQRRMSSMSHPDLSELKAIDGPTSPSRSHLTRSKTMPRHAMNPLANAPELDGLPVDHTKLPKLRRWMLAFVLVNFDLELGPTVQGSYPPLWLGPSESENIAFSSFPDSLQFDQGSQAHSFRIRDLGLAGEKCGHPEEKRPQSNDGFISGS
ncbi:hypothetical protein FIBSPDRAFT_857863 [Athelia psychrophila]|uniref:Uncharacterized protein n=1 Tax=Athelia psychrophila TaxID=1759441 RepID=A0A166M7U9_9AGAM|nr:hypothetical protein FIBSPDRAFT_857863 [Fibularhizoctonia sp. CBS 109695]